MTGTKSKGERVATPAPPPDGIGVTYDITDPADMDIASAENFWRAWYRMQDVLDEDGDDDGFLTHEQEQRILALQRRMVAAFVPDAPQDVIQSLSRERAGRLVNDFFAGFLRSRETTLMATIRQEAARRHDNRKRALRFGDETSMNGSAASSLATA